MKFPYLELIASCICCHQPYANTPAICPDCVTLLKKLNHLDDHSLPVFSHDWRAFHCLGTYEGLLGYLIHQGKFEANLAVLKHLALLFADLKLKSYGNLEGLVVPVPMKTSRLLARGFNQSAKLASTIANRLKLDYSDSLIKHTGLGRVQHKLNREQRSQNMRQAFYSTRRSPERVYVVDDVFTTGATVRAMCQCLKSAGARHVEIWALAKAD